MRLRIGILLQTRKYRRRATDRASGAHSRFEPAAVVVTNAALIGYENARNNRSRAEISPRPRLIQRALFFLDLLKARTAPLPVRVAQQDREVLIVAIHRIDNARVALADAANTRTDRIISSRQSRNFRQSSLVAAEVAVHCLRSQVMRELELRHSTNVATVLRSECLARSQHVVRHLRINVLKRIACLQSGICFVRSRVGSAGVPLIPQPHAPARILDRNLESKLRSSGFDDFA